VKRFNYRFQRILELKERIEEARKAELGEAVAVLNQEQASLEQLMRTQETYQHLEQPAAPCPVNLLGLNANYVLRLQREVLIQLERIEGIQRVVDERRSNLIEATKEKRVYEVLRERAESEYKLQRKRYEQEQLDEVGGQLYLRAAEQEIRAHFLEE
jgi:flagellar FliJ protein